MATDDVEALVRQRLRGLRIALGLSLDDLAERTHLSPSTISRIETGKRTISLDVLGPLCEALQTDLATLLDTAPTTRRWSSGPCRSTAHGQIHWPLTRNPGGSGRPRGQDARSSPGGAAESSGCTLAGTGSTCCRAPSGSPSATG